VRFHFDVAAPEADPKALKSLIRMAFGQRRKTLSNTLKPLLSERIADAGQRAAFAEEHRLHRRAEELVPTEFVDLCRAIYEAG
jgi:16S rRNA A1518/A1519 N6-dimethyltransferase RsmA/KsgA/DIM1 with predicted DNA glycosylase/AP lyase activity